MSWHETCGISNLPIRYDSEARLVVLIKKNELNTSISGGFCYPVDSWTPICLPIKGKYNDFGSLEDFKEDLNTKFLKENLNESSINDVFYTLKEFSFPKNLISMLQLLERGYLQSKDFFGIECHLGQMLIREDIYQAILKFPLPQDVYWYDTDINFQKIEAEKYLKKCLEIGKKIRTRESKSSLEDVLSWKDKLKNDNDFLKHSDSSRVPPQCIWKYKCYIEQITSTECVNSTIEDLKQLLHGMVELLHVNEFMVRVRKHWTPQCGKGSQNSDNEEYRFLAEEILSALDRDIKGSE
jgi:hypothetical protein